MAAGNIGGCYGNNLLWWSFGLNWISSLIAQETSDGDSSGDGGDSEIPAYNPKT